MRPAQDSVSGSRTPQRMPGVGDSRSLFVVQRSFRRVRRGYDPEEVDRHLQLVSEWFSQGRGGRTAREAEQELIARERAAADLEARGRRDAEGTRIEPGATLEGARLRAAAEIADARREAERIVAEAVAAGEQALADRRAEIEGEAGTLKGERERELEEYAERRRREADRLVEAARRERFGADVPEA